MESKDLRKHNGYLQINHGFPAGMQGIDIISVQAFFLKYSPPVLQLL
jgi:hypothetical protein